VHRLVLSGGTTTFSEGGKFGAKLRGSPPW
jgi:hypothetical protein